MVQARPPSSTTADALVTAMFALGSRLKRLQYDDPVEKAAIGVLHRLHCHGDGVRLSDVAAEMHLDLSTVSRHVRHLEDSGLVRRTEDPGDRRASRLVLTDAGRDALRRAYDVRARSISAALSSWSEHDRATLTTLLTRLEADLDQTTAQKDS